MGNDSNIFYAGRSESMISEQSRNQLKEEEVNVGITDSPS